MNYVFHEIKNNDSRFFDFTFFDVYFALFVEILTYSFMFLEK